MFGPYYDSKPILTLLLDDLNCKEKEQMHSRKLKKVKEYVFFSDIACLSQIFSKFLICSPFHQPVFFYLRISHMVPNGYPSTQVYIALQFQHRPSILASISMYLSLNPWKEID